MKGGKKILVAFDGSTYSEGALDYALNLKEEKDIIVGLFIEDLSYIGFTSVFGEEFLLFDYEVVEKMKEEAESQINENIKQFTTKCQKKNVPFKVHRDQGVPVYEIVNESRYADLIVLGYQTFFSSINSISSDDFLKDVLHNAESPVLVVPETYKNIERTIFSFNGDSSAAFAIKQFTYLLGEKLADKAFSLLRIRENEEEAENKDLMKEYLSSHFGEIDYDQIEGEANEQILHYARLSPSPLVVLGAYGRGVFSRFFNKSTASEILKSKSFPIFISHP